MWVDVRKDCSYDFCMSVLYIRVDFTFERYLIKQYHYTSTAGKIKKVKEVQESYL